MIIYLGFVCVCLVSIFIFLFEISIARFGIMCAVEGRSAVGMKREREREGGGASQRRPQRETTSSQGFLFPALLNDVGHFLVSNDTREFQ
jgi:hypothetical protein